jgi:hypothetical protein
MACIAIHKDTGVFIGNISIGPMLMHDMIKDSLLICIYTSICNICFSMKFSLALVEEVQFLVQLSILGIGLWFWQAIIS